MYEELPANSVGSSENHFGHEQIALTNRNVRQSALIRKRAAEAKLARARELELRELQTSNSAGSSTPRLPAPRVQLSARPQDGSPSFGVPLGGSNTSCPSGCTRRGNCDELSGRCDCPFTHGGASCDEPLMSACELPDGETLNLSFLASEEAWSRLRDVANDGRDQRRLSPPFRWLGVVTCECVLQGIRAMSLQSSPMPHQWPPFIEFPFVSLQRVVCVDAPVLSVGQLWERGHVHEASADSEGATPPPLPWAYVPAVAFLKQFPAHSPTLLPPGSVSEEDYIRPRGRAVDLNMDAAAGRGDHSPAPVRMPLRTMLPGPWDITLRPLASCSPYACDGIGWCAQISRRGGFFASPPECGCAAQIGADPLTSSGIGSRRKGRRGGRGFRTDRDSTDRDRTRARSRCLPAGSSLRSQHGGLGGGGSGHGGGSASSDAFDALYERRHDLGPDYWRASADGPSVSPCPNACSGRSRGGRCAYGFCHCEPGFWGLDCSHSLASVAAAAESPRKSPRVHVYALPPALRRSCNWWHLAEDLGERLLRSDHLEADPARADLFWVYGCPNGDSILPALRWVQQRHEHWNASVRAQLPRHVLVVGHEEGWAEVWRYLVHWLRGTSGDHANKRQTWNELHPASPTRQLAILQLSGRSDYPAEGQRNPIRCVSSDAPCYVCFQPGKDVMVPGHPGLIDYPSHECHSRLQQLDGFTAGPAGSPQPRANRPQMLFGGAVWTIGQGPGLYEPSRLVLYLCHKNASRLRQRDYLVVQTETQPESVYPWQVEPRIDLHARARQAAYCVVPEGKAGGYGHRAIQLLMLGCVPLYSKERFSHHLFDEVINWSAISLHVPPVDMPRLPNILERSDADAMRRAIGGMRRRLLWSSIYGPCHLRHGEGGTADAFDTLMEVLAKPRVHFRLSADHRAPRAPEQLPDLRPWLRKHGGGYCTASKF